jgi:20S proteasome subunit beta 1
MVLTESSLSTFAAISHAMARDGSSGGVIRLITIDKDGVSREFIPGKRLHVIISEVIPSAGVYRVDLCLF